MSPVPMRKNNRPRRGSYLIEFVFTAVPSMFLTIAVFEMAMVMWQYHTLAYTAQSSTRYAIGQKTAGATIGSIVTFIDQRATGLLPSKLNASFKDSNTGTTTPCNPITACSVSGTAFPSAIGADVTITLTYPMPNPIIMYWPGMAPSASGSLTLGASSMQRVLY